MNANEANHLIDGWKVGQTRTVPRFGDIQRAEVVKETVEATAPLLAKFKEMREALESGIDCICIGAGSMAYSRCPLHQILKDAQAIEREYVRAVLGTETVEDAYRRDVLGDKETERSDDERSEYGREG